MARVSLSRWRREAARGPHLNEYMDTQQMINLAILRAFAQRNISFAYPTQTVYVQSVDEPRAAA
jgi:small-conductance mechanosensitive channel